MYSVSTFRRPGLILSGGGWAFDDLLTDAALRGGVASVFTLHFVVQFGDVLVFLVSVSHSEIYTGRRCYQQAVQH